MKVCTRCKKYKDDSEFRRRQKVKNGKVYPYRNPTCRKCDSALQHIRYMELKDVPEFKAQNAERSRRYLKENADVVREKTKAYRQTERYKTNRAKYRKRNKDRIFAYEKINKDRYHIKHRDALSDVYIGNRLSAQLGMARNEIPPPLIKLKRIEILAQRTIKQKSHEPRTTA